MTWFAVSAQDGIAAFGKVDRRFALSLSSLPKVAIETVLMLVLLNTGHCQPWSVILAASFLLSFFFQAINAVMLRPVHVQQVLMVSLLSIIGDSLYMVVVARHCIL